MPLRRMTDPTTSTFVSPTDESCLSYAIDDQLEASRSNRAGRTRSRTATLTGNTPLRPDYRMAARSGFAASAAPAPPPKAPFRSSPPPHSAHLDSTIPLGHPDSYRPTPALNPQMDHPTPTAPPVSQHTATGHDACAAAEQLSNTFVQLTSSRVRLGRKASRSRWCSSRSVRLVSSSSRPVLSIGGRLIGWFLRLVLLAPVVASYSIQSCPQKEKFQHPPVDAAPWEESKWTARRSREGHRHERSGRNTLFPN